MIDTDATGPAEELQMRRRLRLPDDKTISSKRPLCVKDVLDIETIDVRYEAQFRVNASGTALAFSVRKGIGHAPCYGVPFLAGAERGRLYLADLETGAVRVVEAPDHAGLSSPVWSPDGTILVAIASDGRSVHPCRIDPATHTSQVLTTRNLAFAGDRFPFWWISDTELACDLLPEGEVPAIIDAEFRGALSASQIWPRAWAGRQPTANVLSTQDEPIPEPLAGC